MVNNHDILYHKMTKTWQLQILNVMMITLKDTNIAQCVDFSTICLNHKILFIYTV